jgi:ribosomal protein L40E
MSKACLSCGTVNPSNAKFCNKCGKPLSSKAGAGTGKSMFCKKCNRQMPVKGRTTKYLESSDPTELNLIEWECAVLECNHVIPIRKTGRKKNDLTSL